MSNTQPDIANALGYIVDNEWTLDEFIEYLESLDPKDYRKYWGWATPAEYRTAVLREHARIIEEKKK